MEIKITEDQGATNAWLVDDTGVLTWIGGSKLAGHAGRVAAMRNASARARKLSEKLGRMAERETAKHRATRR